MPPVLPQIAQSASEVLKASVRGPRSGARRDLRLAEPAHAGPAHVGGPAVGLAECVFWIGWVCGSTATPTHLSRLRNIKGADEDAIDRVPVRHDAVDFAILGCEPSLNNCSFVSREIATELRARVPSKKFSANRDAEAHTVRAARPRIPNLEPYRAVSRSHQLRHEVWAL
jgi:hypothetical protein